MWTYEAIVALGFRWIDLFVVFLLAGYAVFRWVLPFFKQEIAEEQKVWQEAQDRLDNAMQESLFLDHTLTDDQQIIRRLEHQIQQWKALCDKKKYEKDQQHQKILDDLKQKNEQKILGMIHDIVYKKVVPEALDRANHDLKLNYKASEAGNFFVKNIITRMQKGDA